MACQKYFNEKHFQKLYTKFILWTTIFQKINENSFKDYFVKSNPELSDVAKSQGFFRHSPKIGPAEIQAKCWRKMLENRIFIQLFELVAKNLRKIVGEKTHQTTNMRQLDTRVIKNLKTSEWGESFYRNMRKIMSTSENLLHGSSLASRRWRVWWV